MRRHRPILKEAPFIQIVPAPTGLAKLKLKQREGTGAESERDMYKESRPRI
jgi:hypothetical protein